MTRAIAALLIGALAGALALGLAVNHSNCRQPRLARLATIVATFAPWAGIVTMLRVALTLSH